ncbi:hypothetical protein KY313_03465 [Candidatus Woesearchaeota archaeon]|jgi:hypothetical protein|nr:hypothetical protein [Candidatus Woesearchaeota archaeon]
MKITIDTKTDSNEEIKKMISLLENLMSATHSTIVEESPSVMDASPEMFNMFSENKQDSQETEPETKKPETFDVDDMLDD